MSSHHDMHHADEKKPVAFTVPLILSIVTIIIVLLFLSLCDPTHAHENAQDHGHGNAAATHQQNDGHRHATDKENVQSHGEAKGPDALPARESTGAADQH